jgi:hypothetical protein
MSDNPPPHLRAFLDLYTGRLSAEQLNRSPGLYAWDSVLRMGWSAGILGSLADRIESRGEAVPPTVERHFEALRSTVRYRHRMADIELERLKEALGPLNVPVIVAKGIAYLLQGLPSGRWRLFADVDIIVPRTYIARVEDLLIEHGWRSEVLDEYDQRYYREWAHELPPMRHGNHPLELDVHHTILPLTGRVQPDAEALFDAAIRLSDSPFYTLCPPDQVLHACAHLFQDSDLSDRLRELADIDGLLRAFGKEPRFWLQLEARAETHGMQRPLWYALHYSRLYFDTPMPAGFYDAYAPRLPLRLLMSRLINAALPPCDPDGRAGLGVRTSRLLLYIRSLWLRMPPVMLIKHLATKGLRRVGERSQETPAVAP